MTTKIYPVTNDSLNTYLFSQTQQDHQGCAKTQPYYSIYHEIIYLHKLTAPWNIWQLTDRLEARLWACMCGVNNVNLSVIYGKLRQSTLTLTDYWFFMSFGQLGILEQGDNKSESDEIQQLHAMCGPVPKCYRFRRSRDGKNWSEEYPFRLDSMTNIPDHRDKRQTASAHIAVINM